MSNLTFFTIFLPICWWTVFGFLHAMVCWNSGDTERWTAAQTVYMNFISGPMAWLCVSIFYLVIKPLSFAARPFAALHYFIFNRLGK